MTSSPALERLFGTDGVRGRAGEGWLSPAGAARLARAIGEEFLAGDGGRALVGHDGRRSGPELELAVANGLGAAGYGVVSAGRITTPGLALVARSEGFDLAVMLSASHNPAEDNGIKVFGGPDGKLTEELEDRIEARVRAATDPVPSGRGPRADESLGVRYLDLLVERAPTLDLTGRRIAIDCAHGAGSSLGPALFRRLGAEVHTIGCEPNGDNINLAVGSTHPGALQELVRSTRSAVGIALDGDGDRCLIVDHEGELIDGDGILTISGLQLARAGRLPHDTVVATVMSNKGLARALGSEGIELEAVGVGDRRVVEALRRGGYALGGEQSGHIVYGADLDYVGDGLYTALRVLAASCEASATVRELAAPFRAFPQVLVNVPVASKPDFESLSSVAIEVRRLERELGDDGRVLLRYSGTEPLARVMIEGPDAVWIRREAEALGALIAGLLG
ncbi:MAG: phosphoglucosamine mutase [Planctomycetota bacterium]